MTDITIKQYNDGYFEVFQGDKSSGELSYDTDYVSYYVGTPSLLAMDENQGAA